MAVAKSMLFGPIGRQVEVPWPLSGMSSDINLTTETTGLLSGEQAVYRAPVSYKTYNMSWKTSSTKLQPLVDVYSGVYGNGPYYITDPTAGIQGNNLLPAKWAAPHLLAHVANGWGSPVVVGQTNTPESRQVTFTHGIDDADTFPNPVVVPTIPKERLYIKVWGSRTGSGSVQVYNYLKSTASWVLSRTIVPTLSNDVPIQHITLTAAATGDIAAIKLVPYLPSGSTLMLQHIDLAINDYRTYTPELYGLTQGLLPAENLYPGMGLFPATSSNATMFRSGKGIGPVQFTGNLGGQLDSVTIDRIGMSIDLCEVSRDPNN